MMQMVCSWLDEKGGWTFLRPSKVKVHLAQNMTRYPPSPTIIHMSEWVKNEGAIVQVYVANVHSSSVGDE